MSYETLDEALDVALGFSPRSTPEGRQLAVSYLSQYKTLPYALQFLQTSTNEKQLWFATSTLDELVRSRLDLDCSALIALLWNIVTEPTNNLPKYIVDKLRLVLVFAVLRHNSLAEFCAKILSAVETLQPDGTVRQYALDVLSCLCEEMSVSQNDSQGLFLERTSDRMAHQSQFETYFAPFSSVVVKLLAHFQQQVAAQSPAFSELALATTLQIAGFLCTFNIRDGGVVRDIIMLAMDFAANHVRIDQPSRTGLRVSSIAACDTLSTIVAKKWTREVTLVVVDCALEGLLRFLALFSEPAIKAVDDEYLDKLSGFVEAYLTHHLRHLHHARYSASLSSLLGFVVVLTTHQPHVSGLFHCLTVWEVFVTHVEDAEENGTTDRVLLRSYEDGLIGVMQHLVQRMLFASNQPQLDELDDEPVAPRTASNEPDVFGDNELEISTGALQDQGQESAEFSDLKAFVFECFSLVRRITRLPGCAQPLLTTLLPAVKSSCKQFMDIHNTQIPADGTNERHAVHDLTVECALLSCVSAQHVSNSDVLADKTTGWDILVMFVELAEYITTHRLHSRGAVFVELECEILSCVRLCTSCVPFVFQSGGAEPVKTIGESILRIVLTTLDTSIVPSPQNVMQSALNLLACIGSVFPVSIQAEIPSLRQLYLGLQEFCLHLSQSIQCKLYTALSHIILSSGDGTVVSDAFASLLTPVLTSFVESVVTMQQNVHRVLETSLLTQLVRDISICRSLARVVLTKPKQVKVVFYAHLESVLPYSLDAIRIYMNALAQCKASQLQAVVSAINELIWLYSDLFRSIRRELPNDTVGQTVTTLVELFQRKHLTSRLEALGAPGTAVLCAFLKLLRILVEEYTPTLASLLHSILDLCFNTLHEVIFAHNHHDTVVPFFIALMEEILENHYRFFIITQTTFDASGRREKVFASEIAGKYFMTILQAIGTILQQENVPPPLCKQIVVALERIQASHGIFGFSAFRTEVRMAYLHTILTLLTRGRVSLLQEELGLLLFHIAEVDMASFFQVCLPQFVGDKCLDALRCWSGHMDEPTFIKELGQFLNDFRVLQARQ
ncbi:hypothetical protein, variant 1 [Aphanomyces invadans]|uniref:Exportin-1 C-terminal domain-containing protein n=2 Tax=Aphanomyces invadans TaxID=157072 RepID=A0A024TL98_9STRA|nr:hypothetical protein, variant 1 [Aphanomyces invadans]ETV94813.1 hypothetical protein, variant 1 [Aphanomyces invadans]|eukprot:XP_008876407.1 hypothetical protein, variant 1 [Aphanomyces invadans]